MKKFFKIKKDIFKKGFTRIVNFGFVFENVSKTLFSFVKKNVLNMKTFLVRPKTFSKPKFTTGFTLIELLVTLSVFAVTTGIVMYSQGKFDSSVLLSNLAYDVAITIRQAQTFGINVKEFTSNNVSTFSSYGVVFDLSSSGSNGQFNLFSDTNPKDSKFSGYFSCPADDKECVNRYSLKNSNFIYSICAGDNEAECTIADKLTILFTRPNPDAKIYVNDETTPNNFAKIVIASTANPSITRSIIVNDTGQIYVKQ